MAAVGCKLDASTGLIWYKLVQYCFIDGKSHLVTSICVSNNNCAQTVLNLFLDIVQVFGWPSRVRGDHGTENVLVTKEMEEKHGVKQGSYI